MTLQCEEVEFCKLNIRYVAEPTKVTSKRKEALAQFRKVKISGFRAGRAPDYAIETTLKKQIEDWMKRELIAEAYDDILFETKIKPIGYPQVNKIELRDNDFWCDLTVLKKPTVELKQYKNFELPKPHQEYTVEEMVERMLQELRVQHGEVLPYGETDFVQVGDKVTLDISIDGKERPTEVYQVGDKMFADFDDNISGMSAGEERSFSVDLGGKTGQAIVKVHMGMRTMPAPLDDTLAQKIGFDSCDKLREVAKGIATGKLKEHELQELSQQIVRKLVELHEFEMPSWLISMEAQQLAIQSKLKWADLQDDHKEMFLSRARNNVKLALIMDEIKEQEPEAFFSDVELLNVVRQRVAGMGQDPEKFLVEAERDGRLLGLLAALRNEATLQWLVSQSKIVE